jgi:putative drug exporter of the RND superfamily
VRGEIHDAVSGASDVAALLDDPQVWQAQAALREITNSGVLNDLSEIASELPEVPEAREIASDVAELSQTLSAASNTISGLGLSGSAGAQLSELRSGADRLAAGSAQLSDGVDKLVDATNRMVSGLQEASAFLLNLKRDASGNATMGGFFIPASALRDTDLRGAAQIFVSPDGHTVRYLVQSSLNPFSNEIMDQLNAITDVAHNAQPNTALADAQIEMTGFPAINHDLRDYYQRDMKFVMAATLIVVFLILVLLLRAIVAPLHLIASVVVSYLSALGLGVIAFQVIGHQPLSWSVPGMAFIVLVAVGADYNMLLISRVRDESPHSVRTGVIKTVASTGGVITSAGLIFAASMFGLLFGNISGMVQSGFIIGVGLLLDTFLVRTVTVPALAVLIGRANWWPTLWGRPPVPLEPVADYAEIETVDAELVPVSVDLATSDLRMWWTAESVYDRTVRETGINPELLEPVIPEFKWRRWSSRDAAMPFPVLPNPCGVANDAEAGDDADLQLELEMLELEASQSLADASQSLRQAIAR